jgi:hypothetical protein
MIIDTQVQELLAALKGLSQAYLCVTIVANFKAVNRPDKDTDLSVYSKEGLPSLTAYKRAYSEAKIALNVKKQYVTASTR